MTRIHFIYPHGSSISCPDAIGRNVAKGLSDRYEVVHYDWTDRRVLIPGSEDVLLGHAHPAPWTIFRRSLRQSGWKRVIALQPYHHGDLFQMAWADRTVARCDLFLAITGKYWAENVSHSDFAHWQPKMIHVDLAVDRQDFPAIKQRFNPPGARRYLYIGHDGWQKNLGYLSSIAKLIGRDISWIGPGKGRIEGFKSWGAYDFRQEESRKLIADHDFLVIASVADANPAVVLEAMAWGLIPVCTPGSGYVGYEGMVSLPGSDVQTAAETLLKLQDVDERKLREMQSRNWKLLDSHFRWGRFVDQVQEAIESQASPPLGSESVSRRAKLRWAELRSPYFFLRPQQLARTLFSKGSDLSFKWGSRGFDV